MAARFMDDALKAIASWFGCEPWQILERKPCQRISDAKLAFIVFVTKERPRITLEHIGNYLCLNHSTIVHHRARYRRSVRNAHRSQTDACLVSEVQSAYAFALERILGTNEQKGKNATIEQYEESGK